jgi:peptide/nickel transport system substrate-binding protein
VFRSEFSPVATGPLSANTPYYDPTTQNFYPNDPQEAQQLLSGAGFEDTDNDEILDDSGQPLTLKIIIPGWGLIPDVATLLQSQWREMGIDVEIVQVAGLTDLLGAMDEGDYNLVAFNSFGTDPSIINEFYLSNGSSNFTNYADPELDQWLLEAIQATDDLQRQELYRLIQDRIMREALILPIRDYVNLNGWSNELDGLFFSPQGWWPLLNNLQFRDTNG